MSVSFFSNARARSWTVTTPCLCAQQAPVFADAVQLGIEGTDGARAQLAAHADAGCARCGGSGFEVAEENDAPSLTWANANAALLLAVLGLPPAPAEADLHECRRAVIRARSRDLAQFARPDEVVHGPPRVRDDGVIELRPLRQFARGLSTSDLRNRLTAFAAFIDEVALRGGSKVWWA